MSKNYTIKDIADLCGVGKSTISRVLNHDPKVSEETQKNLPLAYIGQNTLLQHFAPNLISFDFGYEQAGK